MTLLPQSLKLALSAWSRSRRCNLQIALGFGEAPLPLALQNRRRMNNRSGRKRMPAMIRRQNPGR